MDFLDLLKKVGFKNREFVGETGFNSSPKTKGVLFRAEKLTATVQNKELAGDTRHSDETAHNKEGKRTISSIEAVLERPMLLGVIKQK